VQCIRQAHLKCHTQSLQACNVDQFVYLLNDLLLVGFKDLQTMQLSQGCGQLPFQACSNSLLMVQLGLQVLDDVAQLSQHTAVRLLSGMIYMSCVNQVLAAFDQLHVIEHVV
jgi:hypothetical protein